MPSRELVLTIDLPLVAGLTLKQFTGVLAHEFGHFSRGGREAALGRPDSSGRPETLRPRNAPIGEIPPGGSRHGPRPATCQSPVQRRPRLAAGDRCDGGHGGHFFALDRGQIAVRILLRLNRHRVQMLARPLPVLGGSAESAGVGPRCGRWRSRFALSRAAGRSAGIMTCPAATGGSAMARPRTTKVTTIASIARAPRQPGWPCVAGSRRGPGMASRSHDSRPPARNPGRAEAARWCSPLVGTS
jgi:hypothetical protein